jgi:hypothetical protein
MPRPLSWPRCGAHDGARAAELDADDTLAGLLVAVDRYAQDGRFHNVDTMGENPPDPARAPSELWEHVFQRLFTENPELLARYVEIGPVGDAAHHEMNADIAQASRDGGSCIASPGLTG